MQPSRSCTASQQCLVDETHSMSTPFSKGGTLSSAARLPCSRPYGGPQNPFTPQSCALASLLQYQDDAGERACLTGSCMGRNKLTA